MEKRITTRDDEEEEEEDDDNDDDDEMRAKIESNCGLYFFFSLFNDKCRPTNVLENFFSLCRHSVAHSLACNSW